MGTSRGSLSVANAVAKLKGEGNQRPDAAVLTSAFLRVGAHVPGLTVFKIANGNARALDVPTMLVVARRRRVSAHLARDGAAVPCLVSRQRPHPHREIVLGGLPPKSEPCEAFAPHGF